MLKYNRFHLPFSEIQSHTQLARCQQACTVFQIAVITIKTLLRMISENLPHNKAVAIAI